MNYCHRLFVYLCVFVCTRSPIRLESRDNRDPRLNPFLLFLDQELINWMISYGYTSCCPYSSYWGDALQKSLKLHRFKWDRDEIWHDCSSSRCASIDGVCFFFKWRHTFKILCICIRYIALANSQAINVNCERVRSDQVRLVYSGGRLAIASSQFILANGGSSWSVSKLVLVLPTKQETQWQCMKYVICTTINISAATFKQQLSFKLLTESIINTLHRL